MSNGTESDPLEVWENELRAAVVEDLPLAAAETVGAAAASAAAASGAAAAGATLGATAASTGGAATTAIAVGSSISIGKAIAAVSLAIAVGGGIAAANGALPGPIQRIVSDVADVIGIDLPGGSGVDIVDLDLPPVDLLEDESPVLTVIDSILPATTDSIPIPETSLTSIVDEVTELLPDQPVIPEVTIP